MPYQCYVQFMFSLLVSDAMLNYLMPDRMVHQCWQFMFSLYSVLVLLMTSEFVICFLIFFPSQAR